MGATKIEWTEYSWNVVTGCTPVSEGCRNCYAERMAKRLAGRFGYPADEPFRITLHPERLEEPLRWKKPRMIFVSSMGDLFHEDVPLAFLSEVFEVIEQCPQHTFLVLTKRPKRMQAFVTSWIGGYHREPDQRLPEPWCRTVLPNLWLGVTAENQARADERIPILLQTPAAVRFVSCEPLLGSIDLSDWMGCVEGYQTMHGTDACAEWSLIDWVIVGGETGPRARPMDLDWVRNLRDQCSNAEVPFFFKQMVQNGKRVRLPELDGQVWAQFPEVGHV